MRTDTKIYNDPNQCELLYAVVLNNVEETKELLAKIKDKSLLEDIGLLSEPFPLHYISLCNEAIWRYVDEWKGKEEAARFRDKSRAMVEFWKEYYRVEDFAQINYRIYNEDFYCAWDDETDEDILCAPKEDYTEVGCRVLDLDLYCAVERFDFDEVERLLDMGANPDVDIYDKPKEQRKGLEEINAMERIEFEESYICSELLWLLRDAEINMEKRRWIDKGTVAHILGLAAHSEMYRLLEKYKK